MLTRNGTRLVADSGCCPNDQSTHISAQLLFGVIAFVRIEVPFGPMPPRMKAASLIGFSIPPKATRMLLNSFVVDSASGPSASRASAVFQRNFSAGLIGGLLGSSG